jgi:hypothetical protein
MENDHHQKHHIDHQESEGAKIAASHLKFDKRRYYFQHGLHCSQPQTLSTMECGRMRDFNQVPKGHNVVLVLK